MDYLIRDCNEADLPALVALCLKHAEHERASYNPEGKQSLLREALFADSPKLFCLMVESENKGVGYASYTFDFSTWDTGIFLYLDCLYVEPDFRGFGIGRTIIEKLKIIGKEKSCVNIQWQTPSFNKRAIEFYNRIGGTGKNKVRFFINL